MNKIIYVTEDGHTMKEGEVMWRVGNSLGKWWGEPEPVIYSDTTGYNWITEPINGNPNHRKVVGNNGKSPFPQKHFFDKELAYRYLNSIP